MSKLYNELEQSFNDSAYNKWAAQQRRDYKSIKSKIRDPRIKSFEDNGGW